MQQEYALAVNNRTQLESQLKENTEVKKEFEIIKEDANIYKLIGPVLVKQDHQEAKQNVQKRIEYITGEIKRFEKLIKELEEKQDKKKMEIVKLEAVHQQQMKAQQ
ncbi:Prefoldin [Gorgonomyces haynaldii]|nr:Prefoldin [Gorgonomyces haynaldii]